MTTCPWCPDFVPTDTRVTHKMCEPCTTRLLDALQAVETADANAKTENRSKGVRTLVSLGVVVLVMTGCGSPDILGPSRIAVHGHAPLVTRTTDGPSGTEAAPVPSAAPSSSFRLTP